MKVINLCGSPGSGKSTSMLGLTYELKLMGLSVENTPEFFKELILEESDKAKFGGQLYVLGEQNRRLARLDANTDLAITDCPLPLIACYTPDDYIKGFHEVILNLYHQYDNYNYFIIRNHEYENEKRNHDEAQAEALSKKMLAYFKEDNIPFKIFESGPNLVKEIIEDLIENQVITKKQLLASRNPAVREKFKLK